MDQHSPIAWSDDYAALTMHVGVVSVAPRTQIRLTGKDRALLLNNLCTNEIRRLEPGEGREAFLTNIQAKVLAYFCVYASADELILDSVPGQGERIAKHLDRYIIREDAQVSDISSARRQWLLAGPAAADLIRAAGGEPLGESPLSHQLTKLRDIEVSLRSAGWGKDIFWIDAAAEHEPGITLLFKELGARICGEESFTALRIESGMPWDRVDITDEHLAQEVNRDRQAISYVKGCYLGQETIARIDALGHVNKKLCLVRWQGDEIPAAGAAISAGDKVVGHVTSSTWSPRFATPLSFAYLRRGSDTAGSAVSHNSQSGEVLEATN